MNGQSWSLMTYDLAPGFTAFGGEGFNQPQTYQTFDIAALQFLYGANYGANSGNNTYTFSTVTGRDVHRRGRPGHAHLEPDPAHGLGRRRRRHVRPVELHDRPRRRPEPRRLLDAVGGDQLADHNARNGGGAPAQGNFALARLVNGDTRSLIENVTGGSGNDTLIGNQADNVLEGGSGVDLLYGGSGDDTLLIDFGWTGGPGETFDGGSGDDTFDFSAVTSIDGTVDLGAGTFTYTPGGAGTIDLVSIENVIASDGDDTLIGNGGSNTLYGGAGNDTLTANGGPDDLFGGVGDDRLIIGTAGVNSQGETYDGGAGIDMLDFTGAGSGGYVVDLVAGTADTNGGGFQVDVVGIENVTGTNVGDTLIGNGTSNLLDGGDGNDILDGGAAADTVSGGDGDDVIRHFDAGSDSYDGGAGIDTLEMSVGLSSGVEIDLAAGTYTYGSFVLNWANFENYTRVSGSGGETVLGTSGANVLITGAGDNSLAGRDGDDSLYGGEGDDTLDGGMNDDSLFGGAGDDTLIDNFGLFTGGNDLFDGGAGIDTGLFDTSWVSGVVFDLALGQARFNATVTDTLVSIENLSVGGDATAIGDGTSNTLLGLAATGANSFYGGGGDDTLIGGGGADLLDGGAGIDALDGGTGLDTASYFGSAAGVTVRLWNGTGSGGDAQGDTLSGIERIIGSTHGDKLVGAAGAADSLHGAAGDDILNGLSGADVLDGGAGLDTADYSGSGAAVTVRLWNGTGTSGHAQGDTLTGIERVIGSTKDDKLVGAAGSADILHGAAGNDILNGLSGGDVLDGGVGFDTVDYSASGSGVIVRLWNGTGSGGHAQGDLLSGIERVVGSGHDDQLVGAGGADDFLHGSAGDDILIGLSGDDVLDGGVGNDLLDGRLGSDTFRFSTGYGQDRVLAFQNGLDIVDLTGGLGFGDLSLSAIAGGVRASIAAAPATWIDLMGVTLADINAGDFV